MKDGTVIEGTVVENGDSILIFRDKQKKIHRIPQKDVSMILYPKKNKNSINSQQKGDSGNGTTLIFNPCYIMPIGNLAEMAENGYGAEFSLTQQDFIIDGLESGVESGFYFMKGKDLSEEKSQNFNRFLIIPLYFTTEFFIAISANIGLYPGISAGVICFDMRYIDHSTGSENEADRHDRIFDPTIKADLSLRYKVTDYITVSFSAGYTAAFEMNGVVNFIVFSAGAGYSF